MNLPVSSSVSSGWKLTLIFDKPVKGFKVSILVKMLDIIISYYFAIYESNISHKRYPFEHISEQLQQKAVFY